MRNVAAVHSFGVIFSLFIYGPWPITFSSKLRTAVFTQTNILILWRVLAILPIVASVVVLWDGSAGCLFRIPFFCVICRPRPVAVFLFWHAQVFILFIQPVVIAFVSEPIDPFILATVFLVVKIVGEPAYTALGTVDIGTFTRSEAWSCFTPQNVLFILIISNVFTVSVFRFNFGSFLPL